MHIVSAKGARKARTAIETRMQVLHSPPTEPREGTKVSPPPYRRTWIRTGRYELTVMGERRLDRGATNASAVPGNDAGEC